MDKKSARLRRARKSRGRIRRQGVPRLSVHRTLQHIYAQVISADGSQVLAAASSCEKELQDTMKAKSGKEIAAEVGKLIAARAKKAKVTSLAFDRSGYKYHGRVAALADAAREKGLEF